MTASELGYRRCAGGLALRQSGTRLCLLSSEGEAGVQARLVRTLMARGPLSPRSTSNSTLSPSLRASKSSCEGWCDGRRFFSILGMDEPEPSVVDDPLNCSLHVASIVVVRGFVGNDWERLG